jgi:hypothetical protein
VASGEIGLSLTRKAAPDKSERRVPGVNSIEETEGKKKKERKKEKKRKEERKEKVRER